MLAGLVKAHSRNPHLDRSSPNLAHPRCNLSRRVTTMLHNCSSSIRACLCSLKLQACSYSSNLFNLKPREWLVSHINLSRCNKTASLGRPFISRHRNSLDSNKRSNNHPSSNPFKDRRRTSSHPNSRITVYNHNRLAFKARCRLHQPPCSLYRPV